MMPRGFPQLALRASRHPAAQTLLVHDPPRPDATPTLRRPQRHDSGACGRIPVPLKPEARAEGMRIATHESARIPSARASGFPAKEHDGQRPPLQKKHPHAAAEGRAACLAHGHPRRRASVSLAGRRRLVRARHPDGQSTRSAARSGRRPRRMLSNPHRRRPAAATAAWRAAAREARGTSAAPPPSQACGGHGWPRRR